MLKKCFGFEDIELSEVVVLDENYYPITHHSSESLPIVMAKESEGLESLSERFGHDGRKRTAFGLIQEYLNSDDKVLWGICTDGNVIRIVRDNSSLTRPAWIEIDIKRIFEEELYADFAASWLLIHRSRFPSTTVKPEECVIEKWRQTSLNEGKRAQDHLRIGVEEALEILGDGFIKHPSNNLLREAIKTNKLNLHNYYQELLRLIYRFIFLLTIEERNLLHTSGTPDITKKIYKEGYSILRLREKAVRRNAYDRFGDLWKTMKIVFLGLNRGEKRLGLPGLGGLFSINQTPHLNICEIDNKSFLSALYRLSWLKEEGGLVRVNWRDMGPEELGSVYESLLELVPQLINDGITFTFATGDETRGNARKLTGSYYTPDSLVQALLDTALDPVVEKTIKDNPTDPVKAILKLTVVDPACGSGHFLLAAARRLASRVAQLQANGTPSASDYRKALRNVISHCIFGVDRNPMAIELARTALWLEAMTPDAPLTFVDHHLACGDALVGLIDLEVLNKGIPSDAYKALTGDDKDVCKEVGSQNNLKLKNLRLEQGVQSQMAFDIVRFDPVSQLQAIENMPDDSPDQVDAKQVALENFLATQNDASLQPLKLAADIFVSAFLAPKNKETKSKIPTTRELLEAMRGIPISKEVKELVLKTAQESKVFHWRLHFAHVFSKGGFDIVLGNPPWERIKLQEQEFFANKSPEIASAANKAARQKLIDRLEISAPNSYDRNLFLQFEMAKRSTEGISIFAHTEVRYPLTGVGDINTYALFAETALNIVAPNGRVGIIVPSGIATDDSTSKFFAHLTNGRLVGLIDFENREGLFPAVDSRMKFCLMTLGVKDEATYSFFLTNTSQINDKRRHFKLSAKDISKLNPNTRTGAIFRSEKDSELTLKIYDNSTVLLDDTRVDGNPWGISFLRMFDMANDSNIFNTSQKKSGMVAPLPLYEAKLIHQYDYRYSTYNLTGDETREVTLAEKADPKFEITPRYWVEKKEIEARLSNKNWRFSWLMSWRDIARVTDERTVIASAIPRVGTGNTMPIFFVDEKLAENESWFLLANLNSIVLDFVARQKVGGTHLTYNYLKQFPIIDPKKANSIIMEKIIRITRQFYYPILGDHNAVQSVDFNFFEIKCEIDATFAFLYGLNRKELNYILDPADVMGEDYPSQTFRVLKEKETKKYGEFRTKRMVLEAWDRLFEQNAIQPLRNK